ncbi:hypothetical protein [Metabacillus malikii]|uniref:Uncharacterized protein n=1 Tax=Metabacillus malikii TaxID=1504265 RepID=A0ABT9ZBK4_9BACI|nr:hypothetical protein [Metabacillus malikii]MDQ0229644.1 hypothetical protein [Metabacillus malikii]
MQRYLPAAIGMCLYLVGEGLYAEKKKWMWYPVSVKPNALIGLPLTFGPFLVGALWIMKYTYGKFKHFLILNIIIDNFFSYVVMDWFKKINYVYLVNLSKFKLSLVFLIKTFLLYLFQIIYDKTVYKKDQHL